jgi:uncharacterized coiled-coil protein SlyX
LISSCNQAELDKSANEQDSLKVVIAMREASINELLSSFNDVERNLDSVAIKQNIILLNTNQHSDIKSNQKERINREISSINNLMEENRKKVDELTRKFKNSTKKNAQLEKTIAILNTQLARKYEELTALNEKLFALNGEIAKLQISIDTLTIQNTIKSQIITSETKELHTAYYIVNKTKELQKAELIGKTGGLLGIGRIAKLNENFDNNKFTRIDYTKTTRITINSEDAKIISSHPLDSYKLEKDKKLIKDLLITNPEKFWSISKYLIVAND